MTARFLYFHPLIQSNILLLKEDVVFTELPGKPVGPLEVLDIQRTNISIRWKPPKDDGGVPLTAYVIEKRDAKRMTWAKVDRIKPDITTYTVQNLVEGNEYFFRVFAENSVGLSKPLESEKAYIPKSPFGEFELMDPLLYLCF